ncbi:MAG: HAD family hydrolase [Oscillospiraceae bacterium]|nr:HAD family hydrolase [Oscillospiraceae bacterium]
MPYKGAIFFDYDGTLVDEQEKLFFPTEKTVDTLKRLQEKGYLVALATGRSLSYVPIHIQQLFTCFVVQNGAQAVVNNQIIYRSGLDEVTLSELIHYLYENDVVFVLENNQHCYTQNLKNELFLKITNHFNITHENFKELDTLEGKQFEKFMLYYKDEKQRTRVMNEWAQKYKIVNHRYMLCADGTNLGITKGGAIQQMIQQFNIKREDTYAFGDGENDIDMFCAVGTGIAMKKHAPALDAVASWVTASVAEEGIYKGINQFGLL